jgi:hypothetical protein
MCVSSASASASASASGCAGLRSPALRVVRFGRRKPAGTMPLTGHRQLPAESAHVLKPCNCNGDCNGDCNGGAGRIPLVDKGVLPFTMRASMTMYVDFEESIGCRGVTVRRIEKRMQNMAGTLIGHVPGQLFHENHSLMFPLFKRCMYIYHNERRNTLGSEI